MSRNVTPCGVGVFMSWSPASEPGLAAGKVARTAIPPQQPISSAYSRHSSNTTYEAIARRETAIPATATPTIVVNQSHGHDVSLSGPLPVAGNELIPSTPQL